MMKNEADSKEKQSWFKVTDNKRNKSHVCCKTTHICVKKYAANRFVAFEIFANTQKKKHFQPFVRLWFMICSYASRAMLYGYVCHMTHMFNTLGLTLKRSEIPNKNSIQFDFIYKCETNETFSLKQKFNESSFSPSVSLFIHFCHNILSIRIAKALE